MSQVLRQPIIGITKAIKGTISKPPREPPPEIKAIARDRLRWNYLDTRTPMVFIVPALLPIEMNMPNTMTRKIMWLVRVRVAVPTPMTNTPTRINLRPPNLSNMRPIIGCDTPPIRDDTATATDIVLLLQPNSSLIGRMNTPKPPIAPIANIVTKAPVETMNQP